MHTKKIPVVTIKNMDDYIHNINLKNEKKANKTFEALIQCAQYYPNPCFYNLIKQKKTLCFFLVIYIANET